MGSGTSQRSDAFGHDRGAEGGYSDPGALQLVEAWIWVVPASQQPLHQEEPAGCMGSLAEDRRVCGNHHRQAKAGAAHLTHALVMHEFIANWIGIELQWIDIVLEHYRPQSLDEGPGPCGLPKIEGLAPDPCPSSRASHRGGPGIERERQGARERHLRT